MPPARSLTIADIGSCRKSPTDQFTVSVYSGDVFILTEDCEDGMKRTVEVVPKGTTLSFLMETHTMKDKTIYERTITLARASAEKLREIMMKYAESRIKEGKAFENLSKVIHDFEKNGPSKKKSKK